MATLYYRNAFKAYLKDVAAKTSSPGGGSVSNLICCVGISLMQMALEFSRKLNKKKTAVLIRTLTGIKAKIMPFIDLDASLFMAALNTCDVSRRIALFKKLNKITFDLANRSVTILTLANAISRDVNPRLMSDFTMGVELVFFALRAALKHLELNAEYLAQNERVTLRKLKSFVARYEQGFAIKI